MTALPSAEDLARFVDPSLCPFCGRDPYHYVDIGVGMESAAVECCDLGIALFQHRDEQISEVAGMLATLAREVLARRAAEAWRPETNILPWVALTIEQMRQFEASSGDLERLGLNGEWIPTDTPLSPGLVYRIKPTPTTEASHGE